MPVTPSYVRARKFVQSRPIEVDDDISPSDLPRVCLSAKTMRKDRRPSTDLPSPPPLRVIQSEIPGRLRPFSASIQIVQSQNDRAAVRVEVTWKARQVSCTVELRRLVRARPPNRARHRAPQPPMVRL
jgi:hypothetical protein